MRHITTPEQPAISYSSWEDHRQAPDSALRGINEHWRATTLTDMPLRSNNPSATIRATIPDTNANVGVTEHASHTEGLAVGMSEGVEEHHYMATTSSAQSLYQADSTKHTVSSAATCLLLADTQSSPSQHQAPFWPQSYIGIPSCAEQQTSWHATKLAALCRRHTDNQRTGNRSSQQLLSQPAMPTRNQLPWSHPTRSQVTAINDYRVASTPTETE